MKVLMVIAAAGALACPGLGRQGAAPGDPEPDRNADRETCFSWCAWNMRQCSNECAIAHPDPDEEIRRQCIDRRCEHHNEPDIGKRACEDRCNNRFNVLRNLNVRTR
jgi:hypothetical protein